MKRFLNTLLILAMVFSVGAVQAQNVQEEYFDAAHNGTTVTMPNQGLLIYTDTAGYTDANGNRGYSRGIDWTMSVVGTCPSTDTTVFCFYFQRFTVGNRDTLYIYDGPSTSSPLLFKANNANSPLYRYFFASASNTSHTLTLRFRTWATGDAYEGFTILCDCQKPCEYVEPVIDDAFYRTRNGVVYDTDYVKQIVSHVDTIYDPTQPDVILRFDTTFRPGINTCMGDGIILHGHGEYTTNTGYYTPSDQTTLFKWDLGTGDSVWATNATSVPYDGYTDVGCYDVILRMIDANNCASSVPPTVRVRVAQNPLKTIYDLSTICTTDSLYVSVGYDGDNATLTLRQIEYAKMTSKTYSVLTFIPDGPVAAQRGCGSQCYTSDVEFTEFPIGREIQSASDICSICVDYEHSFMGDYSLAIVCPTQQKAYLKYKNLPSGSSLPSAAAGGGGRYTGIPYGCDSHGNYDNTTDPCDTTKNMYGWGWNYCFSRNGDYTLVSDQPANTTQILNHYMTNGPTVTWSGAMPSTPAGWEGGASDCSCTTLDSSDHVNKTGYYMPADDFSQLVGCPLNGTWSIEVCDSWGVDNGWVFSWSLDICGVSDNDGCNYQVAIDSVTWGPDTAGGRNYDMYQGKYRGLHCNKFSSLESYVSSPDTAGHFPLLISLFDEFGCQWDTTTNITITRTPTPYLGRDSIICGDQFIVLDAKDYYEPFGNYTYIWDPYGHISDTVHTKAVIGSTTSYAVEVTNTDNGIRCIGRDTIDIGVSVQPIPNFDPGQFPLEGCEPYTVTMKNSTQNASRYKWDFGDGYVTSDENPRHTYSTGQYNFKFYAYSDAGCVDSLIYNDLVTVYSSPDARFSWEPAYPTVSQPYVSLINKTTPDNPDFDYFWEVQYDKDYPYSYHTLPTKDTTFEWYTNDRDISGNYIVRLIARSKNIGPSGNIVYCTDTAENSILIINDFLQFPNVVTPNGDGVNDRFVIRNLVSGQAYPTNCLDIYNKWGARVFHKENISKDEDFWDPGADNTPEGTYFFRFSAKGYNGAVERNGAIEVIK